MSFNIEFAQGHAALVTGKTKSARQASIVEVASRPALTALVGIGGKAGKLAAAKVSAEGLGDVAFAASHNNYRPAAEFFAGFIGKNVHVSSRASFQALPDVFENWIQDIRLGKNQGHRECKKTGAMIPNANLKTAMAAKSIAIELLAVVEEMYQERIIAKLQAESKVEA